ncbi:MAG: hypothetical protein L0I24_14000, partial [Pseudonocardia sp.]|nr:hypothetical protein [Pseudonocardia sp.]
ASNVGHVLETTIGNTITPIPGVHGLSALEIDPEEAAQAYRERIVGPVRGLLPEANRTVDAPAGSDDVRGDESPVMPEAGGPT